MKKLSQEQEKYLKKVASLSDKSYDVVFEGMRSFAEKLDEKDPATADAHLLSVIQATAQLMAEGGTPTLVSLGKDILASLTEYKSFLEKYRADNGGVSYEGRDVSGDVLDMMPDSLHAALDEYSKGDKISAKASSVSKKLQKKAQ